MRTERRAIVSDNIVKNVLKFYNLNSKDIEFLLNTLTRELDPKEEKYEEKYLEPSAFTSVVHKFTSVVHKIIDFDKIIPAPKRAEELLDSRFIHPSGTIDCYEWCKYYWGTGHNAINGYIEVYPSSLVFVFHTITTAPNEIFKKLCVLGYRMYFKYAHKTNKIICGEVAYHPESKHITYHNYKDLPDPDEFRDRLWKMY